MTEQRKGGVIHVFLGQLTVEAAPNPGLMRLKLIVANQDRDAHMLHSLFFVPVGPYNPVWRFVVCLKTPSMWRESCPLSGG